MAYLRKEEDKVELTYPLSKVWNAILKALTTSTGPFRIATTQLTRLKRKLQGVSWR